MADRRFAATATPLAGLALVRRIRIEDDRGFLSRLYCSDELSEIGFTDAIVQINQALTRARGAVRGMHFQRPPHADGRFVSCLRGEVLDIAIDLRAGSSTFLKWHAERLSGENGLSLSIPKGFAHGFQTLTEDCELVYLHTARYDRESEGALNPLDPALRIDWPLPITEMSSRDRGHPFIDSGFTGIPP